MNPIKTYNIKKYFLFIYFSLITFQFVNAEEVFNKNIQENIESTKGIKLQDVVQFKILKIDNASNITIQLNTKEILKYMKII
ncbi:MAG: hypothetical protein K2X69_11785 [Silvanigrellaceae bacterium]|nr:hypothetical protein [Silvanigrellaceae bacterium]